MYECAICLVTIAVAAVTSSAFPKANHTSRHLAQTTTQNMSVHEALLHRLFDGYNKNVRPVKHYETVTNVTVEINLQGIIDVVEVDESIVLSHTYALTWRDEMATWDAAGYGAVGSIVVPKDMLWLPDIVLFDSISMRNPQDKRISKDYVLVSSGGVCRFSVLTVTTVHCPMDTLDFPFDVQTCHMRFGSWRHDTSQVRAEAKRIDAQFTGLDKYKGNGEFELDSFASSNYEVTFESLDIPFSEAKYTLVLKRYPHYYWTAFVLPCITITQLAVIGTFSPSDSDLLRAEKVNLGIGAILAHTVLLLIVADMLPKSVSGLPKLGKYVVSNMLLVALATLVAVALMFAHCVAAAQTKCPPDKIAGCLKKKRAGGMREGAVLMQSRQQSEPNAAMESPSADANGNEQLAQLHCLALMIAQKVDRMSSTVEQLNNANKQREAAENGRQSWASFMLKIDVLFLVLFTLLNLVLALLSFDRI